ncbi:MAG: leucine-rich repeat protein [Clostridia bacterium]|nr:leucine-rich repeat protein [Clostridia bacterium]
MKVKIRKVSLTALFVMLIAALAVFNASAENEGPYTYAINEGKVTITDCDMNLEGDIVIPDTLGGIPVTAIGDNAFYYCGNITSVTMGDNIESIGANAFNLCGALYEVILPEKLTEIKPQTFFMCFNLTKINLGQTNVTVIGNNAFGYCDYLSVAAIPDTVTEIGDGAFSGCGNLETVIIGKNVRSIGINAFRDCYNLRTVYCTGTEAQWQSIEIGSGNDMLTVPVYTYEHKHEYSKSLTRKATCLRDGAYTYKCSCGDSYDKLFKGEHTLKSTVTKATASKDGKIVYKCTLCGKTTKTTKIYKASSVKLSSSSVVYNGKTRTPKVTVKNSAGTTLTQGKHYTVKYESGRKLPGKYYIKITFKGSRYKGSKTLYLTIKPQTVELTSAKSVNAGKAVLKWGKETADGYQIYMASSKDGTYKKIKSVTKNTSVSYTVGSLTKGKTYYFKVRAYKKTDCGTVFGSFSNVKSVRIK